MQTSRLQFAKRELSVHRNKTGLVFRDISIDQKAGGTVRRSVIQLIYHRSKISTASKDPEAGPRGSVRPNGSQRQGASSPQVCMSHGALGKETQRKLGQDKTIWRESPQLAPEPRHTHWCFCLRGICPCQYKINRT